jgi:hypothetical protein
MARRGKLSDPSDKGQTAEQLPQLKQAEMSTAP